MTPYALEMLRAGFDHTLGTAEAWTSDAIGIVTRIAAAQSFECTAIEGLAEDFARNHFPHHVNFDLMFLPAPIVWIEYQPRWAAKGQRLGYLLTQDGAASRVKVSVLVKDRDRKTGGWNTRMIADLLQFDLGSVDPRQKQWDDRHHVLPEAMLAGLLTIINQPSGVLRQQQLPHRGFERRARALGVLDGVELKPWTRLVLERPGKPKAEMQGPGASAVGGKKCYHFVRAHWREANGQFVKAHWRGDPALGIGRKSYLLRAA